MKKYILRNRHTLLASVITVFATLVLLEAGLSGRELFRFEIDNSFLQLRLGDEVFSDELEFLDDIGIEIEF